jgi:dTMP kinase
MGWEQVQHPYRKAGRFIVLEGIDGCGSTTQLHQLSKAIFELDKRYKILMEREPSDGCIGWVIRDILHGSVKLESPDAMLALFQADRYEHLSRSVLPALNSGTIVLQDRYWYSTLCYQKLDGSAHEKIIEAHKDMPIPDCVIIYNVSARIAESRRNARSESPERYDALELQQRIADNYAALPSTLPKHPFHIIDADKSIEDILADTMKIIEPILPYYNKPMLSPL